MHHGRGSRTLVRFWGVASDGNAPAIARASALSELASCLSQSNVNLARAGLSNSDQMVPIGGYA